MRERERERESKNRAKLGDFREKSEIIFRALSAVNTIASTMGLFFRNVKG
jgi:hypothetical protein